MTLNTKKVLHPVAKEFRLEKCWCYHNPRDDFVRSQWQKHTVCITYVIYRWIIALFFLGTVLAALIMGFADGKFFIYFTNWGILMCLITNMMGAILVSLWYFHPKYSEKLQNVTTTDHVPLSFRIYWTLHTTTLTSSLVVTIIYWGLLYPLHSETIPMNVINVFEHALNSVLMVLDLFIVAFPIRIYHIFASIFFALIYAVFSVIYYAAGGLDPLGNHYIYPILDWSNPGEAMTTVALIAVLYIIFPLLLFLLYKVRVLIHTKFNRDEFNFPVNSERYSFDNRGFKNDGIPRTSL